MDLSQVKEEAKRAAFVVARGVRDLGHAFEASAADHGPSAASSTDTAHAVAEAVKAAREGAQGLVRATIAVRNHHNSISAAAGGGPDLDRERQVKEAEEQAQKVAGTALRLATAAPRVAALPSPDARREAAAAVDRVRAQLFEDVKALLARLLALLPPAASSASDATLLQSNESYAASVLTTSSPSSRAGEESTSTLARQLQADDDEEKERKEREKQMEKERKEEEERARRQKKAEEAESVEREIRALQRMKEEREREEREREEREREGREKANEERERRAREEEERQREQREEASRRRDKEERDRKAKKEDEERRQREEQERQERERLQQERQKQQEEQEKQRKEEQQQQLEEQEKQRKEQEQLKLKQEQQQLEEQEKQRKEQEQLKLKQQQKEEDQQKKQQQPAPQTPIAQEETRKSAGNPKPKTAAVATGPELKVIAVNTFRPEFDDELAFVEDDVFSVFAAVAEDTSIWWGRHRGKEGIFPSECVEVLQGEPDKLVLKSVEEDETESAVEQQPTDADSFVPLALLLPTTEVSEGEVQVKAVSDYKAASDDELSFVRDDVFPVTAVLREDDLYLWGKLRGRIGYFPRRFVVVVAGDVTMLPERAIEEEELRRQHEKLQRKLEAMEKQRQRQEDELKKTTKKGQASKSDEEDKKVDVDREQRVACKTCESEVVIRKGVLFGICEDCGALVQRERREEDAEALKQKEAQREAEDAARRQREEDERKVKREEYEKKREDDEKRKREEWERKKREDEERKRQLASVPAAAPQEEPQVAAAAQLSPVAVDDIKIEVSPANDTDAPQQPEKATKEKTKREKEGSYIFGAHRSDAVPKVKFAQDKQRVSKPSPTPSPTSSASITSLASSASTPSGSSAARAPSAKWGSTIVPPTTASGESMATSISPRSPRTSDSASSSSSASPASSASSTPLTSPRGGDLDAPSTKTKKTKKQRSGTLKRLSKKEKKTKTKEEDDGEKKKTKTKKTKTKAKTKKEKAKREQGATEREKEMERELAELKQMLMDVQAKLAQKEEEERRRLSERRQSMALTSAAAAAYDSSSALPQIVAADPRKLPSASQPPKLGRRESLLHLKQVRESNQQGQGDNVGGGAGGGGAWGKHTLRKIDGLQRTGSGRYITGDETADEESRRKDALRRGIVL